MLPQSFVKMVDKIPFNGKDSDAAAAVVRSYLQMNWTICMLLSSY